MKRYPSNRKQLMRLLDKHRDTKAVAPFPGKNPLHLTYFIYDYNRAEMVAEYTGKLSPSSWRAYRRACQKYMTGPGMEATYKLFDRLKVQAIGNQVGFTSFPKLAQRFFYGYGFGDVGAITTPDFSNMKRIKLGPYWLYDIGLLERTPENDARVLRQISTTVPVLRSVA